MREMVYVLSIKIDGFRSGNQIQSQLFASMLKGGQIRRQMTWQILLSELLKNPNFILFFDPSGINQPAWMS